MVASDAANLGGSDSAVPSWWMPPAIAIPLK
jgi:hypothetical protein